MCGKPTSEDFTYCGSCGWLIEEPPAPEPLSPSGAEQDPAVDADREYDAPDPLFASEAITVEFEPIPDSFLEPVQQSGVKTHAQAAPPSPPSSPAATVVRIILSVLLGVLGFALILALVVLIIFRPGNIPEIVAGADVAWVLEETEIGDVVVEGLNQSDYIDIDIDIDDIRAFLERENVASEFGYMAEKYARAIAEGDFEYYLTSKEIIAFIKAISPDIKEEFGATLSSEDYDVIADSINDYVDLKDFRVETVLEQASVDVAVPHAFFSSNLLIIVALLFALSVFNIVLLNRKRIGNTLLITGIPITLSGLVFVTLCALLGPFSGFFSGSDAFGFIGLASGMTVFMLIPGFSLVALGALCITLFFVARKARAKRAPKASPRNSGNTWIVVGLTTNLSALAACFLLSLLFYLNL